VVIYLRVSTFLYSFFEVVLMSMQPLNEPPLPLLEVREVCPCWQAQIFQPVYILPFPPTNNMSHNDTKEILLLYNMTMTVSF
jgi:hypothetical protein